MKKILIIFFLLNSLLSIGQLEESITACPEGIPLLEFYNELLSSQWCNSDDLTIIMIDDQYFCLPAGITPLDIEGDEYPWQSVITCSVIDDAIQVPMIQYYTRTIYVTDNETGLEKTYTQDLRVVEYEPVNDHPLAQPFVSVPGAIPFEAIREAIDDGGLLDGCGVPAEIDFVNGPCPLYDLPFGLARINTWPTYAELWWLIDGTATNPEFYIQYVFYNSSVVIPECPDHQPGIIQLCSCADDVNSPTPDTFLQDITTDFNNIPPPLNVTFTDDSGFPVEVVFSEEYFSGDCDAESVIIRTWTGTDHCGNASTISQTINAVDSTPPFINAPDTQISCDESPDGVPVVVFDDSGDVNYSISTSSSLDCGSQQMIYERSILAEDGCGNSTFSVQIIYRDACLGCMDTESCNYDPSAECSVDCDYSCFEDCPGDFDGSGSVSVSDLLYFLTELGCTENCLADMNGDEVVGIADLLAFLTYFGETCDP